MLIVMAGTNASPYERVEFLKANPIACFF